MIRRLRYDIIKLKTATNNGKLNLKENPSYLQLRKFHTTNINYDVKDIMKKYLSFGRETFTRTISLVRNYYDAKPIAKRLKEGEPITRKELIFLRKAEYDMRVCYLILIYFININISNRSDLYLC